MRYIAILCDTCLYTYIVINKCSSSLSASLISEHYQHSIPILPCLIFVSTKDSHLVSVPIYVSVHVSAVDCVCTRTQMYTDMQTNIFSTNNFDYNLKL